MRRLTLSIIVVAALVAGYYLYPRLSRPVDRLQYLRAWRANPAAHADWQLHLGERCGDAPFIMPTEGYAGFLWGDSFRLGHTHQGVDIFGPTNELNTVPVVAAYPGYLTRESAWVSTVIIRVPSDPLNPGRQIWVYYTHMADEAGNSFIEPAFPRGTFEQWVEAGTLLGRQGNYSGEPGNPTGMHLHISVVKDNGYGGYENELEIANTYDPSPYLGLELNTARAGPEPPTCAAGV